MDNDTQTEFFNRIPYEIILYDVEFFIIGAYYKKISIIRFRFDFNLTFAIRNRLNKSWKNWKTFS